MFHLVSVFRKKAEKMDEKKETAQNLPEPIDEDHHAAQEEEAQEAGDEAVGGAPEGAVGGHDIAMDFNMLGDECDKLADRHDINDEVAHLADGILRRFIEERMRADGVQLEPELTGNSNGF